ncbi:hypothetical protein CMU59_16525 [Elizabethkingia anophelis]|uniref:hypothetical protein n=1 Tax=Elizabethkingia anophelis TaxID=1117645 RepID=UPI002012DB70|nr:hypothetical protein [Elizabethkingia anophelis]MCL1689846.1 hypothetical protein [Elizabethkingia anophelis]MDV3574898.1 hypothetical protein [Elizabethkingia anophelis]MDV3599189.1 hypothetical protein [Elizabethkingia anophelis]MDV3607247.1 hypothetical protein [Elizabethkingia anophelis]MDV3640249.1 hypothetical protein [Elizabethkingia anophelis]
MKILKKIVLTFLGILVFAIISGYIYFDQKFTPEKNYLTVEKESGKIPITWPGENKNVLLLPVHFSGDSTVYYLQFDTGSPYTLFYTKAIKNIKGIATSNERSKATFYLGNTTVTSDKFRIIDNGESSNKNDSLKIIGTLGADILEDRKTVISLKENYIVFNLAGIPDGFGKNLTDFTFKKRHIIIPALLKGNKEKFLYDSGTSAYELLTTKEIWEGLKSKDSEIVTEKANSWQNVLTTYTAKTDNLIKIGSKNIPLNNVTYVEGFSQTQYSMMKFSGMTGMLGNQIFMNNSLYIDCLNHKLGVD